MQVVNRLRELGSRGIGRDERRHTSVPDRVDRIVVQQFDPARPFPGGIDTCLRGIVRYLPVGERFVFVGVDSGGDVPGRKLGEWEEYDRGNGKIWFLPVVKLDPGDQKRRLPHSIRLVLGTLRYRNRLPTSDWFQAHRVDTAWALRRFLGRKTAYFVHTQENGLTGQTSDSFWRLAPKLHQRLERKVVRDAAQVVVFNDEYGDLVRSWNPVTQPSPTWFDPDLINGFDSASRKSRSVVWVGRLEIPKDPLLAIDSFKALLEADSAGDWRLEVVGSGTLAEAVERSVAELPAAARGRITLHGRTEPARVASLMAQAGVFLMTSHQGYEGYPRVLVEALASGLPSVVTLGSDTGKLIVEAENGFVTSRNPDEIAAKIRKAADLQRAAARASVAQLSAPEVISTIYKQNDVVH